jgi:cytochrome c553
MKKILCNLSIALILFSGCDSKDETAKEAKANVAEVPKITIHESGTKIETDNPLIHYDIDGNRQVRISPDGVETPLTRQIGAIATIRNNYENLNAKLLSQRLSKNYIVKCSACHDDYANGVIGPSLLTKSADDIYNMIEAYRHKTKVNELMKYLVMQMGEEEIRQLANEIAEFNKEIREGK